MISDRDPPVIETVMLDGSKYTVSDQMWCEAFLIKYGDRVEKALNLFVDAVNRHWEAETVPSKHPINLEWGEKQENDGVYRRKPVYENHADLAPTVLYPAIRVPLMALALKKTGLSHVTMLGIDLEGEITEYFSEGPVTKIRYSGPDEVFSKED